MAVDQQQHPATVPPHDLDAEESVLGAMLVSANAISIVSEMLRPEDFYRRSHATIYAPILTAVRRGRHGRLDHADQRPAEPRPARGGGRQGGGAHAGLDRAGGRQRLPLRRDRPRRQHLPQPDPGRHRDRPARLRAAGRAAGAGRPGRADRCSGSPTSASRATSARSRRCSTSRSSGSRQLHESGRDITGVATGFRKLDKITAGFQPSNLIILAARPGMGKTSLALNIAAHVGIAESAAGGDLLDRDVARRGHPAADVRRGQGRLEPASHRQAGPRRVAEADRRLLDSSQEAPIYVDDTAGITALEIKAKTRRLKARQARPGAGRDRLPAADVGRRPVRQPRATRSRTSRAS